MTDAALVAQKLAFIETCVQELRTLAHPAEILHDVREARFVLRNILVHGYAGMNLEVVRDIVEHRLADLLAFVTTIRARLP